MADVFHIRSWKFPLASYGAIFMAGLGKLAVLRGFIGKSAEIGEGGDFKNRQGFPRFEWNILILRGSLNENSATLVSQNEEEVGKQGFLKIIFGQREVFAVLHHGLAG